MMYKQLLLWPLLICIGCKANRGIHSDSQTPTHYTYEQITKPIDSEDDDEVILIKPDVFLLDIDHAGNPELFVEDPLTRSNSGTDHTVYREHEGKYEKLGTLFCNPDLVRAIDSTDKYPIRIIRYWRSNSNEASVDTLVHKDGEFVVLSTEIINASEDGADTARRRFEELFGR